MTQENYEKEFAFQYSKKIYLAILIIGVVSLINILLFHDIDFLLAVAIILLVFGILGYLVAYKKAIFLYKDSYIEVLLQGGFCGLKNKEFKINVNELESYIEIPSYKGLGYLRFIMKDSSIVEIPYSPYVNTYIGLRSEILNVLRNNNIEILQYLHE